MFGRHKGLAKARANILSLPTIVRTPQIVAEHPKGTRAWVLLTSVFGPYAQDDEFGSRAINPMELYHNQVTRAQGAFSGARKCRFYWVYKPRVLIHLCKCGF